MILIQTQYNYITNNLTYTSDKWLLTEKTREKINAMEIFEENSREN